MSTDCGHDDYTYRLRAEKDVLGDTEEVISSRECRVCGDVRMGYTNRAEVLEGMDRLTRMWRGET